MLPLLSQFSIRSSALLPRAFAWTQFTKPRLQPTHTPNIWWFGQVVFDICERSCVCVCVCVCVDRRVCVADDGNVDAVRHHNSPSSLSTSLHLAQACPSLATDPRFLRSRSCSLHAASADARLRPRLLSHSAQTCG